RRLGKHAASAGHDVREPHERREADTELPDRARARPVGDGLRDEAHREHAVRKDAAHAGRPRERLVLMDRVEVPGGAGVARELDAKVGDARPPPVKGPIGQIQLTRHARGSGGLNPTQQDEAFARAAGMGGVFAHGMLSMGFVAQAITDWAGAGTVRKLGVRFAALVRLADVVTCRGRVLSKSSKDDVDLVELEVWAENQRGEKVVTGRVTVALASRG